MGTFSAKLDFYKSRYFRGTASWKLTIPFLMQIYQNLVKDGGTSLKKASFTSPNMRKFKVYNLYFYRLEAFLCRISCPSVIGPGLSVGLLV